MANWKTAFFLLLLIVLGVFLCPFWSYGANLHLKVDLELKPNAIEGSLQTVLQEKKIQTFETEGLHFKEAILDGKPFSSVPFKESALTFLAEKPNSPLFLYFEKSVNFTVVPFNFIDRFIPLPREPFTYEITLKVPKKLGYFALIPSEDYEVKEEGGFLLYKFKNLKPIKSPVLILSKEPFVSSVLTYKNLKISLYSLDNNKVFSKEEVSSWFQKVKPALAALDKKFSEVYPFSKLFVFLIKDQEPKLDYSNTLLVNSSILDDPWEFSALVNEKRLKEGVFYQEDQRVKGLALFLKDVAQRKVELRKKLLSTSSLEGKSFFYFLELKQRLGEEVLLSRLKHFYEAKLFIPQSFEDLLTYLKSSFPEVFVSFSDFSVFKKLYLRGEVVFLQPKDGGYELTLALIKSNSPHTLTPNEREVVVKFSVVCKNMTYSFEKNVISPYQIVQVWLKERPEEIYLDPDYTLWRILEKKEEYVGLDRLLENPGVLIYPEEEFLLYQKIIEVFRKKGYKILPVKDPSQVVWEEAKNVVYLHRFPFPWMIKHIDQGVYFKLVPQPFEKDGMLGYFFSSSVKETELVVNLWHSLNSLTEGWIKSGKIFSKKTLDSQQGILVPVRPKPEGFYTKTSITTYELALQLANTQLVLIGEEGQNPASDFTQFYREFLENLHQLNDNLIITLDLPSSYQSLIDQFLENKVSAEYLKKELSKVEVGVNLENLIEVLRFAKIKKIKVLAIGVEESLFQKVLDKGIFSLSQEEISNLPEMDLMNPLLKTYLYEKYQQKKQPFPPFENFYQAHLLKKEALTEKLLQVLEEYPNFQTILITTKEEIITVSGITQGLQKKNFLNFKRIILDNQKRLSTEAGDYLFNGGESSPR
ncbi:ChaN family lipoprotein [Thermodesulfobacterium sp.]|nr:ChaN family lipoprotein [Thermodesulfobacterium sp.]MBZ4681076.1 hypothetical protein [Thermodesulfobacterium sp.]